MGMASCLAWRLLSAGRTSPQYTYGSREYLARCFDELAGRLHCSLYSSLYNYMRRATTLCGHVHLQLDCTVYLWVLERGLVTRGPTRKNQNHPK